MRNNLGQFKKGHKTWEGKSLSTEHKLNISLKHRGLKASQETRIKMSQAHKGNKSRTGQKQSIEERLKKSASLRGEKSPYWKGGITPKNLKIRKSIEMRLWREAVFSRDNWTCKECDKKGGKLNAHHIKPFSTYPELRFAIDNGRTLCVSCHQKTDTWGTKAKNYQQVPINQGASMPAI